MPVQLHASTNREASGKEEGNFQVEDVWNAYIQECECGWDNWGGSWGGGWVWEANTYGYENEACEKEEPAQVEEIHVLKIKEAWELTSLIMLHGYFLTFWP